MMKNYRYLIYILIFLLTACDKDVLINDCSLPYEDLLCKTYLFENDACIGYLEYEYNALLQNTEELYKTTKGKTEKAISKHYNSQGLVKEFSIKKNNQSEKEKVTFSYTNTLQVDEIAYYKNDGLLKTENHFYLQNDILEKIFINYNSEKDSVILFEYDTENKLWRKSFFDEAGALLNYEIYTFYDNYVERVDFYNSKNIFQGYQLTEKRADSKPVWIYYYNRNNELLEKIFYEYERDFLIKQDRYDEYGSIISYRIFFYS